MIKYVVMDRKTELYFKYIDADEPVWTDDIRDAETFDDKYNIIAIDIRSRLRNRFGIEAIMKSFEEH